VKDQAGVRELADGDAVAPGAHLLLKLWPAQHKRAAAVLLEPGVSSVVYDGPARYGALPDAFEWMGQGRATLLVVLHDSALDAKSIRSAADAPRGADVFSITLRR
jgi:hypothetical protein